jgi:hypothetical protein
LRIRKYVENETGERQMSENVCLNEREKKSFDFALEVVKQQITLATGILALLLTAAQLVKNDLEFIDVCFLVVGSALFFLSIASGCFAIMGLTFQLTDKVHKPSVSNRNVRGMAKVQTFLFLIGILLTIIFGISITDSPESENTEVLSDQKNIVAFLPPELASCKHIQDFAKVLAQWNSGDFEFPQREILRNALNEKLENAVKSKIAGYETKEWKKQRLDKINELPLLLETRMPLSRGALKALLWVFAINLPAFQKTSESVFFTGKNSLSLYLLIAEAQKKAIKSNTKTINVNHVMAAAFSWWTNVWPFCSKVTEKKK